MVYQALTANRLLDGEVVYRTQDKSWSDDFAAARLFEHEAEANAALEAAGADILTRIIVDPYLFAVNVEGASRKPASVREVIRMQGPTVRRDLGKQARQA